MDVGIAMGSGSDMGKDVSDIVLTDDNVASILNAIEEEGRRIFDNIQMFVLHVLLQNLAKALILSIGLVIEDQEGYSPFPLGAVEIIWLVMITTALLDVGLGFEQAAIDIPQRSPQSVTHILPELQQFN